MKKSVRIRKALPGEKPGYYNKTAKFLKKAQMGAEVSSPSMDPQRINTIYTNVYTALKNDATPDIVYSSLTGKYALDQQTALMIIKSAMDRLTEEGVIDPDILKSTSQTQNEESNPSETQDRETQEEYAARMSEDAENDELAMSDEGYYDEEEAANNTNSSLETEEDEQQQAFRYGGYFEDGGGAEDYSDYVDESNQTSGSNQNAIINQYNTVGKTKMEKPFSMEDLISMTPGTQDDLMLTNLQDYVLPYKPLSSSFSPSGLPEAQYGGLPKAQTGLETIVNAVAKGPYDYLRTISPMTNMSALRKLMPLATLTGKALTKLPYVGSKLQPQLKTTFTQNRNHLWEVLNGAQPKPGIFSNLGSRTNADGSLQVDRLLLYQDDIKNIIQNIEKNKNSEFKIGDLGTFAQQDGLVSGVYPMDTKIIPGVDDSGNKFFEFKHTFGPNQQLPFGTTPSKAKEVTLRNRFYYNTGVNPETNEPVFDVFGPLGEPLQLGTKTKYAVKRPFGASVLMNEADTLLRDPLTAFPNYTTGFGKNPQGPFTSKVGRTDVTEIAPATFDRLSARGKIGRGIENYALGTWLPQAFGLGNPLRTSPKNVEALTLPVLGYTNSALGPNVLNPALESGVAEDIRNATDYNYRIGRNALLGTGAAGYLGYNVWDSIYNECQCTDPAGSNYQAPDEYGNCPCNTDVGDRRTLDPTGVQTEEPIPSEQVEAVPDSMKFLTKQGLLPTKQNYYRLKNKNKRTQPVDYKKGGQLPKYQTEGEVRAFETALDMYNNYRAGNYYGTMSPGALKGMSRNIPNMPEWLATEQNAQRLINHWPTYAEIADALEIQRNILNNTYAAENIPTPLWRQNLAANRLARETGQVLPINSALSQSEPVSSGLSRSAMDILAAHNARSNPQSQPTLPRLNEITYDDFINLSPEAQKTFSQQVRYPFSVISDSGKISLKQHYDEPNKFYFYANMENPIEAGRTMLKLGDLAFPAPNPEIEEPTSLSFDSFNMLTNMGRRKDWQMTPIGHIGANSMAMHSPLKDQVRFTKHYSKDEIEDIRGILDNMIAEKGLIDQFGDRARMKIDMSHYGDPDNPRNPYNFYFPNFNLRRKYNQGGITKKQFVKALTSRFEDGGQTDPSLGKGNRMDTLTSEVEARKQMFKGKLKNNSNIAISQEIYKNAQSNPKILDLLTRDGYKENLAGDQEMQTAQYGGMPDWYSEANGGFVNMDAENPLVKFLSGGNESEYYEPYDLPEARNGMGIGNAPSALEIKDYIAGAQENMFNPSNTPDIIKENWGKRTTNNCPPGSVWNAEYNMCIPKAAVHFNPRVVRGKSTARDVLVPWNRAISYAGSWAKQKSSPYYLGTNNPYMGQLGKPAASYVTKKGIFGQPKKWIDIYDVNNTGQPLDSFDIEQITGLNSNKQKRRQVSPESPNRRDMLEQTARNQFGFSESEWQDQSRDSRRDMMRDVRSSQERSGGRENRERSFAKMRAIDADRDPRSLFASMRPAESNRERRNPFAGMFAKKSQYGGDLNEYGPGGINDPSEGGMSISPSGFSTYGYDTSGAPMNNQVQNLNAPATDFRDTTNLNNAMFQRANPQKSLVGVENKRKNMLNFDGEAFNNSMNVGARTFLNVFDPEKKTQCGPGTTWNSDKQICEPDNAMDIYATSTERKRGDWGDVGSKAGYFRYDDTGANASGYSSFGKYGGYMQPGGFVEDDYYLQNDMMYPSEGEDTYMSDEQINAFLAAGGQIEYL